MLAEGRVRLCAIWAAVAVGVLAAPGSGAAARQAAPWCAYLGGFSGSYDCSYYTFEQCMATARGLGNSCAPNPWAMYEPAPQRRRVRR